MQAIMGPDGNEEEARRLLRAAEASGADALFHMAVERGLGMDVVLRRAAHFLGFAYFDVIADTGEALSPARPELLADIRVVRVKTIDRMVTYAAPDFAGLLNLHAAAIADETLFRRVCIVPHAAMKQYLARAASEVLITGARQNLTVKWPHAVAGLELGKPIRYGFALALLGLVAGLLALPFIDAAWPLALWMPVMLLPTLLRLAALMMPDPVPQPGTAPDEHPSDMPIYSVLVPLRDEADMVNQLCLALNRIDYPAHRLDIIFVVEARSPETLAAVSQNLDNPRFCLLEVPHALPLTKPKALDFALPFCRGEFVVVFDAEDRPEPDQLRRVLRHFRRAPNLHCIQARLVIANGRKGVFPALFAGEYAGLFSVFLPALARWGVVMPLGGTSNHFRLSSLRAIGGWDAYNVTEDADLGVRLARRRLACGTSTAVTWEDAPETFPTWVGQRARWMKGWMQTFLVHNRHPRELLADLGWRRLAAFELIVISMVLGPLLHTGFLILAMVQLAYGGLALPRIGLWALCCVGVMALGYCVAIATAIVGLRRTGQTELVAAQFLLPVYWLLIAWATLRALRDLVFRPFHWIKTRHSPATMAAPPPQLSAPESTVRP
jgi:cellulose synthase/poly-beta-1,6-N-acetylglucosamine synthase-like glycosyltransferase